MGHHQRGLSIIELMIGMTIGLIVLMGVSSVYLTSHRGGRDSVRAMRLNEDMRAVMDIMVADIRRAGYWQSMAGSGTNPFTATATNLNVSGTCILFTYDATFKSGNTAAVVDNGSNGDFSGFRYDAVSKALQTLRPGQSITSTTTDCTTLQWENLTDPTAVEVTGMTVDLVGSQCAAFDPAAVSSTLQTWTLTSGSGAACVAGAPGAPAAYPAATRTFVEVRQVNLVIAARHPVDQTLSNSLSETVVLRNNRVISP